MAQINSVDKCFSIDNSPDTSYLLHSYDMIRFIQYGTGMRMARFHSSDKTVRSMYNGIQQHEVIRRLTHLNLN